MNVSTGWSAIRDNPLLQWELLALRRARWQRVTVRAIWGLLILVFILAPYFWEAIGASVTGLGIALGAVMGLRAIAGGAACIVREKELQTWEALATTRLASHEIILAKAVPIAYVALLPMWAGAPILLFIAWMMDLPVALVAVLLAIGAGTALVCTALGIRFSATTRRTVDAVVRTGLVVLLGLPALVAAVVPLFPRDGSQAPLVLLPGMALLIVLLGCASYLLAAAASVGESVPAEYTLWSRISGGASYLGLVAFVWLVRLTAWMAYPASGTASPAQLLGSHTVLFGLAAAVICARSVSRSRRPDLALISPFQSVLRGALGFVVLLHLLSLLLIALSGPAGVLLLRLARWKSPHWFMGYEGGHPPTTPDPLPWFTLVVAGAWVLFSAAWGRLLAARVPNARPAARAILSVLPTLALVLYLSAGPMGPTQFEPVLHSLAPVAASPDEVVHCVDTLLRIPWALLSPNPDRLFPQYDWGSQSLVLGVAAILFVLLARWPAPPTCPKGSD